MNMEEKEKIEIDYWKNAPHENPGSFDIENILNKLSDARVFLHDIDARYKNLFDEPASILELGGGQSWASCILKLRFPRKKIISSDISQYAMESAGYWERLFNVRLDGKIVCKSYEIPLNSDSVDLVFVFQSFHHFAEYEKTIKEVYRILDKGGVALFLYEPSCPVYIYPLAKYRVSKKRPEVPEDVLKYAEVKKIAEKIGFDVLVEFDTNTINREPFQAVYYSILQKVAFLRPLLPCTTNYILKKKNR